MSRPWIIAYDIADDRRRRALASLLGTRAQRVQESVFEGWFAPEELCCIEHDIAALIDPACDTVRLYPVGDSGIARRETLGAMPSSVPLPAYWLC